MNQDLVKQYINSYIVNEGKALLAIIVVVIFIVAALAGMCFFVVALLNAIANSLM